MRLSSLLDRQARTAAHRLPLRRMPRSWVPRTLRFLFRAALPISAATVTLGACSPLISGHDTEPEPCVQTHDQGCVLESEYEGLVDEVGATHAERSSFQNQWGLETIRADRAYAHLELQLGPDTAPGDGVSVGIVDTGIDGAHPQFHNTNVIERFLFGATDEVGSEFSHGTAVASVVAGEDLPGFDFDAQGVAWGADLVVFAVPIGPPSEMYEPIELSSLSEAAGFIVETADEVVDWRYGSESIDFVNLSIGFLGSIESFSEEELREHFAPALASLAQEGSEERVILVWAAGNANGLACDDSTPQCVGGTVQASSVELLPGLAVRIPELRGHTVGVVSVGPDDGLISDFSNRCGIAADYCLAAPGEDVTVAYFGPDREGNPGFRSVGTASGTSVAAPMVTGGLALMKQFFRSQVSNTDLLSRLLETADRSGPYADAEIYGRGLMDLGAATSPVGETTLALGDGVEGPGAGLHSTSLTPGLAFGDAFGQSLEEREMAAFDALGAPFWYEFGDFASAATGPSLAARLRDFQRSSALAPRRSPADTIRIPILDAPTESGGESPRMYLARAGASSGAKSSHFALAGRSLVATLPVTASLSATALTTEGLAGQEPASGAALTWRPPGASLGLRAGWMGERRTLLGTGSEGAFGNLVADSVFAGIEADAELGQWRLGGTAEIGTVHARARNGMFGDVSPLVTSTFALHATRQTQKGGAFRVSLSQPLRVEDGHTQLAVPSGRTTAGEVVRSAVAVGLEPSGRQVDLALQWQHPLELGILRLGATWSREPGHRKNADSELILLSGWRRSF